MEALSEKDEKYIRGWSWGAFFGSWIFLFVNKQHKLGLKFLALAIITGLFNNIPILILHSKGFRGLLALISLGLTIWLAIRGREIVWKSGVYSSVEEFRKKQSLVTKLILALFIIMITFIFFTATSSTLRNIRNPEPTNEQIMKKALSAAIVDNGHIEEIEFTQGYEAGMIDGKTNTSTSFISNQTSSYQIGYQYGFQVACVQIYDNNEFCLRRLSETQ